MHHDAIPFATALFCLLAAGTAQSPATDQRPVPLAASATLTEDELGRPIAIGPDWECEFDATGARFLPVLGSVSPVLMDLRLRAASVRRGEFELALTAEAAPLAKGDRVSFRRGEGVVERFDVTPAGLEHSLVLERPIGTRGDLVVTIAIGGNAAGHGRHGADGTLRFTAGRGGVDYGALTAIDANGNRCGGALRLAPGALEWVVPARFADAAAFPLVLDPLVGTNFQVTVPLAGAPGSANEADVASDLAYDATTDSYLVVWQRRYTAGIGAPAVTSIRGQRLAAAGTALGSVLAISLVDSSRSPAVANVNRSDRFAVAWVQDFFGERQVRVRAVNAGDGAMSSSLYVAGSTQASINHCDITGESSGALLTIAQGWVTWIEAVPWGGTTLRGARVAVPGNNGALAVSSTFVVAGHASSQYRPAMTPGCSGDGRIAVAYASSETQVDMVVFDRNGAIVIPAIVVYQNPLTSSQPGIPAFDGISIDGGGSGPNRYVVAVGAMRTNFQTVPPTTQRQLDAVPIELGAQVSIGAPVSLQQTSGAVAAQPRAAWRAGKAYVVYRSGAGAVVLRGLDPQTCMTCESPATVIGSTSLLEPTEPTLCLGGSGGGETAVRGLVVWTANIDSTAVTGPLFGRRFDVFSSLAATTSLGGGCGGGGSAHPTGSPYVGNTDFGMQLLFADPASLVAVFNWNSPQPLLGCGPCQWLPFGGTITTLVTNGSAQVSLPIPCDASLSGVPLDTQWTVWQPGVAPCPIVPDFALSNALRLHIH